MIKTESRIRRALADAGAVIMSDHHVPAKKWRGEKCNESDCSKPASVVAKVRFKPGTGLPCTCGDPGCQGEGEYLIAALCPDCFKLWKNFPKESL